MCYEIKIKLMALRVRRIALTIAEFLSQSVIDGRPIAALKAVEVTAVSRKQCNVA
jgi:predicted metalloenzyme YecM